VFIVRDKPPTFEEVAGHTAQSVIAIAIGTRLDGTPNIVGTGFALEWAEHFATCWHVAKCQDELVGLSAPQLQKVGLKDATLRVALREGDQYIWNEIQPKTWFRAFERVQDICVYRIVGLAVRPLYLYQGAQFAWGAEVGVIGFPLGNELQGATLRPYVLKTVISGGVELPVGDGTKRTPRVALATAVAGGFSGGPVFLATDGQVTGMVASTMLEEHEGSKWAAGISLAVPPVIIRTALQGQISNSTRVIKESLRKYLP
jgi:hypothetical protein